MNMQSTARITMQPACATCTRATPVQHAVGYKPCKLPVLTRSRPLQRQVLTRAENPIEKAKEAAQDFGDAIKDNAEDTAEKTDKAVKSPKTGKDDSQDPGSYRATGLQESDRKYAPKSDPTDLGAKKSPNEA